MRPPRRPARRRCRRGNAGTRLPAARRQKPLRPLPPRGPQAQAGPPLWPGTVGIDVNLRHGYAPGVRGAGLSSALETTHSVETGSEEQRGFRAECTAQGHRRAKLWVKPPGSSGIVDARPRIPLAGASRSLAGGPAEREPGQRPLTDYHRWASYAPKAAGLSGARGSPAGAG